MYKCKTIKIMSGVKKLSKLYCKRLYFREHSKHTIKMFCILRSFFLYNWLLKTIDFSITVVYKAQSTIISIILILLCYIIVYVQSIFRSELIPSSNNTILSKSGLNDNKINL